MSSIHNGGYKLVCPACGSRMRLESFERPGTRTVRSMHAQCKNMLCGLCLQGTLSMDYSLVPSKLEAPLEVLPPSPSLNRPAAKRERPTMAEFVAECRARGMSREDTLIAAGCSPDYLKKLWPTGKAPVQRQIEACRASGMSRDETKKAVKCDRTTFALHWPSAVAHEATQHA